MQYDDGLLYAERRGYEVDEYPCSLKSFCVPVDGTCAIAINPEKLETRAEKKAALFHELGHCETGSFYNQYSPCDIRERHERRAQKWAIKQLIPEAELKAAVKRGCSEVWQLAEYFGVPDDFMLDAIKFYKDKAR